MDPTPLLTGQQKQRQWQELAEQLRRMAKAGPKGLRSLSAADLTRLIDDYQALTADLARARSLGAAEGTVDQINRIAVLGHNLLYSSVRPTAAAAAGAGGAVTVRAVRRVSDAFGAFPRAVRRSLWAVLLSAAMLFGPAVASYTVVQIYPQLGFDLAGDFYSFDPTSKEHLHEVPTVARPVVSSKIMTTNWQVTIGVFALGLTLGIGTTFVLIINGVHVGAVAGWLTAQGKQQAIWGWIMPHGGTEMLSICLAGAAGYLLAGAILAPGQVSRATALKRVAGRALVIELGCLFMLIIAGMIEGFVSPSSIGYPARVAILIGSLVTWAVYFLLAGHLRAQNR